MMNTENQQQKSMGNKLFNFHQRPIPFFPFFQALN